MQEGKEIDQGTNTKPDIKHTTIILISLSLVSPKIGKIKRRRAKRESNFTIFSKQK